MVIMTLNSHKGPNFINQSQNVLVQNGNSNKNIEPNVVIPFSDPVSTSAHYKGHFGERMGSVAHLHQKICLSKGLTAQQTFVESQDAFMQGDVSQK